VAGGGVLGGGEVGGGVSANIFYPLSSGFGSLNILIPSEASHVTVVDGCSSSDLGADELRRGKSTLPSEGKGMFDSIPLLPKPRLTPTTATP